MLMKEEMASGVGERVAALEAKLKEQGDAMAAMQRDMADMRRAMAAEVESTKGRINDLEAELAALKDGRAEKSRAEREESSAGKRRKREESPRPGKEGEMEIAGDGGKSPGKGAWLVPLGAPSLSLLAEVNAAEGKGDEVEIEDTAESESEEEWGANGEEDFDAENELQELCDRVVALEKRMAVEKLRKEVGGKTWEALLTVWIKVSPGESRMDIIDDYLTDAALSQLASFRSLTSINLSESSGFTAEGVTQLYSLTSLTFFNLEVTNATDASLEGISSLKHLNSLYLGKTKITDAGVAKLRWLTALVTLALDGCESITSASMVHVGKLTSLETLWLVDSGVREDGLKQLTTLTSLKLFSLPPGVTDSNMKHLRNLTRLEKLGLWDAKITAKGVNWLKGLNSLKVIGTDAEEVEWLIRDGLPGMIVTDSAILE